MKFLHAADLHIDSPFRMLERYEGAPVEQMRHATRRAMANLVDLALKEEVDFVLLAGDIYDGDWRDVNTGLFFIAQVRRLEQANIPLVMIAGNHDAANKMTRSLRLPPNVTMLSATKPQTVHLDSVDVSIHGQSFANQSVCDDLSRGYPAPTSGTFNIGILHTCAEGQEGHAPYAPCKISDLKSKGYDYWALGHIHTRAILHDDPYIVFPGNIQGRHIRECGPKGCVIVTVERAKIETQFHPLDVARWECLPIDVSDFDSEHDIVQAAADRWAKSKNEVGDRPLIVRLELTGASRHADRLRQRFEQIENEIRAESLALSGDIWIEKVLWKVRGQSNGHAIASDAPIGYLLAEIQDVVDNEQVSAAMSEEIDKLLRSLPPDVASGIRVGEHWLRELVEEAKPDLMERLLADREVAS